MFFLLVFFILSEANASVKHCFSGIRGEEWGRIGRNGYKNEALKGLNKQALFLVFSNKKQEVVIEQQEGRRMRGLKTGGMELEGLTACHISQ